MALTSLITFDGHNMWLKELIKVVTKASEGDYSVWTDLVGCHSDLCTLAEGINLLIAAFKEKEEALVAANRQLQMEIHACKKAEGSLKLAKDAAEVAIQARSAFLANMSREIRTPLNSVIDIAGTLLDSALTGEQRNYVEMVRANSESLMRLINDILDYSKIEAETLDLQIFDFDLKATLDDVADLLASAADAKGIEFRCAISHDIPTCLRGDPVRLHQILMHFGNAAIKLTQEQDVVIRAEREIEDDNYITLRFSVTITGTGISVDSLDGLFQSFPQPDAFSIPRCGGIGSGLAICKKLCRFLGGDTGVEIEQGKGFTFWIVATFQKQPVLCTH